MYSTPSTYVDAIRKEKIRYPVNADGGFNPESNHLGSGILSARPIIKKQVRDMMSGMYASSKLYSLLALRDTTTPEEVKVIL